MNWRWMLTHFLIWFLVSTILLFYLEGDFFWFGVLGLIVILAIDYAALRIMLKYVPFAIVGLILGFALNYYML